MAYSANGITWRAVSNSTFGGSYINGIAYGNNKFVAVGNDGKMAYSLDGVTWTAVSNSRIPSFIRGIAYGNNRFIAVGDEGIAYSDDGITWTAITPGSGYAIAYGIAPDGAGRFVAVGQDGKIAYADW
jgi:hypothetical protein